MGSERKSRGHRECVAFDTNATWTSKSYCFAQRPVNLFRSGKIPAVISQCQVLGRTLERFSGRFPTEQIAMLGPTKVAVSFALVAFSLMMEGRQRMQNPHYQIPSMSVSPKSFFRLDFGRSLANDESVWTPGENVGRSIEFSSTCWLVKHGDEWLLWDTGVPEAALNDPKGWSTLPKLIVCHLDRTLTDQLA